MSLFVIADLDSSDGSELIKEALGSLVRRFLMSVGGFFFPVLLMFVTGTHRGLAQELVYHSSTILVRPSTWRKAVAHLLPGLYLIFT
jgi:hypothetical protein